MKTLIIAEPGGTHDGKLSNMCFEGPAMAQPFEPTAFWAVTEAHLDQQRKAMRCYGDEFAGGEWELLQARAVEYGYRVGTQYAEGFEVVMEVR